MKGWRSFEYLTGRWWFYLLLLLVGFGIPPYSSVGYPPEETRLVVVEALRRALVYPLVEAVWPSLALHLAFALVVLALVLGWPKAPLLFDLYSAAVYAMVGVGQGVGFTERYGLVVITGNVILVLMVAASWAWECAVGRNAFDRPDRRRLWLVPLALLALWAPPEPRPDPLYLLRYLTAGYFGAAYCLTTPAILTVMLLYYPRVNVPVMRLTAFVGLCFAVLSMVNALLAPGPRALWQGLVLHAPLLITCAYALWVSGRGPGAQKEGF